jgi:hypothetical protein
MQLAKEDRLHINTAPVGKTKASVMSTALTFVMSAVMRSALAYAGQQLGKTVQQMQSGESNGKDDSFSVVRTRGGI